MLLQALASNFPSKMHDLDAYVSRYCHFGCFWKVLCVLERFCAFWKGFARFGKVLRVLRMFCALWKLNFQAVIKSAASAAAGGRRLRGSPQAIGEAALAADLITA